MFYLRNFFIESITVKLTPGAKWFKMNPDELGFYRVNYDKKSWKALKDQLMANHEVRQSFPYENHCECHEKLALRSLPVLLSRTFFLYMRCPLLRQSKKL